ncbi:DUF2750 domain-containing protein [Pontibacter arcticus]|uniref:DUF2750 domain-containing protein n=1 Tax=Pontibacter arcticus TaxID=2080288 RepID=A0A364RFI3_9BACT|nr:DUF2750 domain-containing protein [Pontibacter arcticus]RAU83015.1 DUF2750 domain-containing protein [Pontibacter arcticus]
MIQDSLIVKQRHERFIKKICETEIVIGLESKEGFATSSSNNYEDEVDNPIQMICFWSEKALAKACVKDGWSNYTPTEIPLSEFLENWCVGMNNDGLLIGTNFDQNMFGHETEPFDLILEIITELKNTDKKLDLQKFEGIEDLEKQVKEL